MNDQTTSPKPETSEQPNHGGRLRSIASLDADAETFTQLEVLCAIEQFLEYGEKTYHTAHKGYFSKSGWAARCLRFHRDELRTRLGV